MVSRRQGWKTADELLAELEEKPEYIEQQRELAEREAESRRRYTDAAAGLLSDLEADGFPVTTLAELRQWGVGVLRAMPALVKWLPLVNIPAAQT